MILSPAINRQSFFSHRMRRPKFIFASAILMQPTFRPQWARLQMEINHYCIQLKYLKVDGL